VYKTHTHTNISIGRIEIRDVVVVVVVVFVVAAAAVVVILACTLQLLTEKTR
jgi:hypothetical protein